VHVVVGQAGVYDKNSLTGSTKLELDDDLYSIIGQFALFVDHF